MNKRTNKTSKRAQLAAATLIAAVIAVFVFTGIFSSSVGVSSAAESVSTALPVVADKYSTAPTTTVDPALTDLAKQIKPCPDFSGNKFPGELLSVTLSLPASLNGTGDCGPARRRPLIGRPTLPRPARTPTPQRSPTPPRTTGRGAPGGVTSSTGTVGRPRPRTSSIDIPCQLLPGGCPDPLPTGGGGLPGTPETQLVITNVNVKWGVFESVNGRPGRELVPSKDFVSPSMGLSTSFVMAPLHVAELTPSAPPADPFMIVAKVTISADKKILSVPPSITPVTSEEVPIQVPLSLSALQVPKVFGLFLDLNYGGAAALYLPANSTLNKTTLPETVRKVADIYNPLASKLNFVTWFATYMSGLQSLQHAFALEHWDLKELKDRESNLNDDDFIHRSALSSLNDTEVEDEASSMLLIGLPDTSVQFFQDRSFGGMHFTAKAGTELVVLVPNLISMQSTPANRIIDKTFTASKTPNNSLSSFKWLN